MFDKILSGLRASASVDCNFTQENQGSLNYWVTATSLFNGVKSIIVHVVLWQRYNLSWLQHKYYEKSCQDVYVSFGTKIFSIFNHQCQRDIAKHYLLFIFNFKWCTYITHAIYVIVKYFLSVNDLECTWYWLQVIKYNMDKVCSIGICVIYKNMYIIIFSRKKYNKIFEHVFSRSLAKISFTTTQ